MKFQDLISYAKSLSYDFLDLIFPPFCIDCEKVRKLPLFCEECWKLIELIDPKGRCIHCFEESNEPLCLKCRKKPELLIPSAFLFEKTSTSFLLARQFEEFSLGIGSYFWMQWNQLGWKVPDLILPLPGMWKVGLVLSDLMQKPALPALCDPILKVEMIEEEKDLLLIAKQKEVEEIREILSEISWILPKKVYLLTFF